MYLRKMETLDQPDLCLADRAKPHQALVETRDDMIFTRSRINSRITRSRTPPLVSTRIRDSASPTVITDQLRGEAAEVNSTKKSTKEIVVPMVTDLKGKEAIPAEVGPQEMETDETTTVDGLARKVRIEDRKREQITETGTTIDDLTMK